MIASQCRYMYYKPTLPRISLDSQTFNRFGLRTMATSTSPSFKTLRGDVASFHDVLKGSKRVLALCGAGLSASSGLPTFRGAGGLWRTHDSISLATPGAFAADPGLVWQFYGYRRHMALHVQPNPAHYALAELARKMPGFQCLTQNVDGLSQRAEHPRAQLQLLHGTLFDLLCADKRGCGYGRVDFTDPVTPALAVPTSGLDLTSNEARQDVSEQLQAKQTGQSLDISDIKVPLPSLTRKDLPQCPKCNKNLLRPGVVWFGEQLSMSVLDTIEDYLDEEEKIDLILVIGTSAKVYPAAGYVEAAREHGARVAVINMDENDVPAGGWSEGDWFFQGDAAEIIPALLRPVIGEVVVPERV
jgi:NAD-dependent deacetylase sirtuin 5